MPVVAEVFDAEQTIVGGLGVRQHIPGCRAIDKPLFQQKPDKLTLRHNQFFGRGAQVGAVFEVDEQVIKSGLSCQSGVFFPQCRIFFPFCQQIGAELQQRLRGSGNLLQLFLGHVGPVLADRGQHLRRNPPAEPEQEQLPTFYAGPGNHAFLN